MLNAPETLPWYKSRVIVGALVSAVLKILYLTGWVGELADGAEAQWVDVAVLFASFIGDAVAARARVVQEASPKITVKKGN